MKDAGVEIDRADKLGLGGSTDFAGIELSAYFLFGQDNEIQKMMAQMWEGRMNFLPPRPWLVRSSFPDGTARRRNYAAG